MAVKKPKLNKTDKATHDLWLQIENNLRYRYNLPQVKLYNVEPVSGLLKQGYYTKVVPSREGLVLQVDKRYLTNAKRTELIETAVRVAVKIYFLYKNGRAELDSKPEIAQELAKYHLLPYGEIPEGGMDMHVYTCSGCNAMQKISIKKVSKSKNYEYNTHLLTKCCEKVIKYDGKQHFTNQEMHKLKKFIDELDTKEMANSQKANSR